MKGKISEVKRADVKVGYACNNNCIFCVVADKRDRGDFTTAQLKREILAGYNNGANELVLTGGEVTIRKDLLELVEFAKDCGYPQIQIQTNGRMLACNGLAEKLLAAGATQFSPALHGHCAEVHDSLTRSKGSFAQTVAGIKRLKKLGAYVLTNTVVTKGNCKNLIDLAKLLVELNVNQFQFAFVHPQGNALRYFDLVVPSLPDAAKQMQKALDYARSANIPTMVEAVPLCFMQGYEEHCSESYIPATEIHEPGGFVPDFGFVRVAEGKAKGEVCGQCSANAICEGPWREYPQMRGWSEFKAVKLPESKKVV